MRNFIVVILSLAAVACHRGDDACPEPAVEDTGAEDTGAEELEIVGQLWTLLEVPAWDSMMLNYLAEHDAVYCFRLSSSGAVEVWDDGGYHWSGDQAGAWASAEDASTFDVAWIRFSSLSEREPAQGWRWIGDELIVTDGTEYDADAIPVSLGCPFDPA